jgi:hypothetical protein
MRSKGDLVGRLNVGPINRQFPDTVGSVTEYGTPV